VDIAGIESATRRWVAASRCPEAGASSPVQDCLAFDTALWSRPIRTGSRCATASRNGWNAGCWTPGTWRRYAQAT